MSFKCVYMQFWFRFWYVAIANKSVSVLRFGESMATCNSTQTQWIQNGQLEHLYFIVLRMIGFVFCGLVSSCQEWNRTGMELNVQSWILRPLSTL